MQNLTFCTPVVYNYNITANNYHYQRPCLLDVPVIDEVQQIVEKVNVFNWEIRKWKEEEKK